MSGSQWRPGVAENLGFYVYVLIDPRDDDKGVFYVGKGTEDRCFAHVAEANTASSDRLRDYEKLQRIRDVEAQGYQVGIDILCSGISEDEALLVEAAAIDLLSIDTLSNRVLGHGTGRESVEDVNARLGAIPAVFNEDDELLLIRISRQFHSGMNEDELYEATRKWWRLGKRRSKATHALAVHAGVVRRVFRIDDWEPADEEAIAADPKRAGRWVFNGEFDPAMNDRFCFADVTAVFDQGSRNPVRYIGC